MVTNSFVAGKDFPPGVYNIIATSGSGVVSTSNDTVHVFLGTATAIAGMKLKVPDMSNLFITSIPNITIYDGIPLTINGPLTIKLTPTY